MSIDHYRHIAGLLFDQPWAITPRSLERIIHRVDTHGQTDLEAVASKLGRPLDNTGNRVEIRGSVAILDINGPIFRYANVFSMLSGATSVELLARDFQAALDNPQVEQIFLRVDSPGGEAAGISDFADQIRAGNARKPVIAFIDYLGASAAYWLAAAAGKIYGSESSFSGSIGIVASYIDRRGAQERQGIKQYNFVSSQTPLKNADPATEEGQAQLKSMVDSLADLFINRVAAYRGVDYDRVLTGFGRGAVLPARLAQTAGMIDEISNEEALIASLNRNSITVALAAKEESVLSATTNPITPVAAATAVPDLAAERQRIREILELPEAQGRENLAQTLATQTDLSVASAQQILRSAPAAPAPAAAAPAIPATPPTSPLEREMARIPNPDVGLGRDDDTPVAEASRILAFLPAHQKVQRAS